MFVYITTFVCSSVELVHKRYLLYFIIIIIIMFMKVDMASGVIQMLLCKTHKY